MHMNHQKWIFKHFSNITAFSVLCIVNKLMTFYSRRKKRCTSKINVYNILMNHTRSSTFKKHFKKSRGQKIFKMHVLSGKKHIRQKKIINKNLTDDTVLFVMHV